MAFDAVFSHMHSNRKREREVSGSVMIVTDVHRQIVQSLRILRRIFRRQNHAEKRGLRDLLLRSLWMAFLHGSYQFKPGAVAGVRS